MANLTQSWWTRVALAALAMLLAACSGVERAPAPTGIPLPTAEPSRPKHTREVQHIFRDPTGAYLATVDAMEIVIWTIPEMAHVASIGGLENAGAIADVELSPAGDSAAIAMEQGDIFVWHRDRDAALPLLPRWSHIVYRLIGFWGDDLLWVRTDGQLMSWQLDEEGNFKGEGRYGYVGRVDHATATGDGVLLWGSRVIWLEPDDAGEVRPVALNAVDPSRTRQAPVMGPQLASIFDYRDGLLQAYDTVSGASRITDSEQVRVSKGPKDDVVASGSSPDGKWLAVGWRAGGLELWETEQEALVWSTLIGAPNVRDVHPRKIRDVVVSAEHLWVLLPEQTLLRIDRQTREQRAFEL